MSLTVGNIFDVESSPRQNTLTLMSRCKNDTGHHTLMSCCIDCKGINRPAPGHLLLCSTWFGFVLCCGLQVLQEVCSTLRLTVFGSAVGQLSFLIIISWSFYMSGGCVIPPCKDLVWIGVCCPSLPTRTQPQRSLTLSLSLCCFSGV